AFLGAVHHQNLATGLGVARLREAAPNVELGTILSLQPCLPAAEGEEHELAAELADAVYNRAFLDPLFGRGYPEPLADMLAGHVEDGDLDELSRPLDVLGVNYYTRLRVRADAASPVGLALADPPPASEVTAMGWEVYPRGLYDVLMRLREDYGGPRVVVTECGAAFPDEPDAAGRVDDERRARFVVAHLRAALAARAAGCDLDGFLVWTLVDNLEWTDGFAHRFGLVRLVPETLERVPKRSYAVLPDVAASGAVPPPEADTDLTRPARATAPPPGAATPAPSPCRRAARAPRPGGRSLGPRQAQCRFWPPSRAGGARRRAGSAPRSRACPAASRGDAPTACVCRTRPRPRRAPAASRPAPRLRARPAS